jgi:hypothetical protein
MDISHRERMDETFELARAELAEERDSKSRIMSREVERHTEMAQRVIKRMLQGAVQKHRIVSFIRVSTVCLHSRVFTHP